MKPAAVLTQDKCIIEDCAVMLLSVILSRKSLWCIIAAHFFPEGYKAPETSNKRGLPIWCHKPLTLCFTAHTRYIFAPCCIGLQEINTLDILGEALYYHSETAIMWLLG